MTNNFFWNRHWTFATRAARHAGFQAARFLAVSLAAFLFSLRPAGTARHPSPTSTELAAQAIAIVCATPLSFLGNRLWSFRA